MNSRHGKKVRQIGGIGERVKSLFLNQGGKLRNHRVQIPASVHQMFIRIAEKIGKSVGLFGIGKLFNIPQINRLKADLNRIPAVALQL